MAATQLKVTKNNSRRKANKAVKSKGREQAGREGRARKDGVDRLRWAADRRVGRDSEKLAELLSKRALDGDLASTKVLVALADGKKVEAVKKEGGVMKLLQDLAAEPQWEGEEEEAGNRE